MKNSKWIFRILLYLSLVLLIVYLVKLDYLSFQTITFSWQWLIVSTLLLWIGFFLSTVSWQRALTYHGYKIDTRLALISHGLSVFAKYLPGKIWMILGRAAYVGNQRNVGVSELSFVSLKEQILYILIGLLISFLPAVFFFQHQYWVWIILLTALALGLVLFVQPLHQFAERIMAKILRKKVLLPVISIKLSLRLGIYILLYWTFFSLGFYFLIQSLSTEASLVHAFAFPLAVSYGVLALFTPGGIGVREGILSAFLAATGLGLQEAITISALSRLWFISGEVFIFLLALAAKYLKK
ncbi:MAG: flippase-like domain-containing protein [Bacteroidota bacterium]|nr:MAG: flippase-like domain-containing protein [Bacteroidota bacterium]